LVAGGAGVAEVGVEWRPVRNHTTVQIEGINKARVSMLEFRLKAGLNRDWVKKQSIVRVDHLNSATLFAMAPHCTLAM